MISGERKGFALLEIMIVAFVVGILSAIAIPNFGNAKQVAAKNACIANLKRVQGAVQMWSLDTCAAAGFTPTTADLVPAYITSWPKCGKVSYEVSAVDANPVCPNSGSYTDHTL